MKLKTEKDWCVQQAQTECLVIGDVSPDTWDACAAHAFWLAVHEESPRTRIRIHERALILMRDWGME